MKTLFQLMNAIFEHIFIRFWNWLSRLGHKGLTGGLWIGLLVVDGRPTKKRVFIPHATRAEHVVVEGKTGTGKSFFLKNCIAQDIRSGRGFIVFDPHNDLAPFIYSSVAAEEKRTGQNLSNRLIPIEPANTECAVGINPLQAVSSEQRFVFIVGLVSLLQQSLELDRIGVPTAELLRNAAYVASCNGLSLLEIRPLLTDSAFLTKCLKQVENDEVRSFFTERWAPMSEPLKAVRREAVINKIGELIADPHYKYILGQRQSTFDMQQAMDEGKWIVVSTDKARLGKHSSTFASIIFAHAVSAIFRRQSREIFSLYCDELQNLTAKDTDLEVLLAEARKFGVSVVSANQFSEQVPAKVRAAMGAVGTRIYFQLSGANAQEATAILDGGKSLTELLKNLPKQNFIAKTKHYPWIQAKVPTVSVSKADSTDLLRRARLAHARRREEIEWDIVARRPKPKQSVEEALDAWQ